MEEILQWRFTYEEWTSPKFLSKGVKMVREHDEKGMEITKKIRKELDEVFEEHIVRVVFSPTG